VEQCVSIPSPLYVHSSHQIYVKLRITFWDDLEGSCPFATCGSLAKRPWGVRLCTGGRQDPKISETDMPIPCDVADDILRWTRSPGHRRTARLEAICRNPRADAIRNKGQRRRRYPFTLANTADILCVLYINSTDFDRIMRLQIGQWVEKNKRSIPLFRCCGRRLFLSLYLLDSEHTLLEFLRPLKTHLFCWGQQRLQWLLFLERFINVDHTYLLICLLYCEIFCFYPPIYTTVMTNSSLFLHNCCSVFIGHHTHVSWSIMLYLSHWKFRFWNSK